MRGRLPLLFRGSGSEPLLGDIGKGGEMPPTEWPASDGTRGREEGARTGAGQARGRPFPVTRTRCCQPMEARRGFEGRREGCAPQAGGGGRRPWGHLPTRTEVCRRRRAVPFQLTTTSRRSFTVACGAPLGSWEWLHSIPCSKRHVHRVTMYDVLRDTYLTCPLRMEILVADITSQILQCSEGHTLRQGIAGAKHTTPMGFSRQVACPPQRTSLRPHSHFLPSYPPVRHLLAL